MINRRLISLRGENIAVMCSELGEGKWGRGVTKHFVKTELKYRHDVFSVFPKLHQASAPLLPSQKQLRALPTSPILFQVCGYEGFPCINLAKYGRL